MTFITQCDMVSPMKRLLSIIALCTIVFFGFIDPADAAPMGPPSVECHLNGGVWHDDPYKEDPDYGWCEFPEVTTTTTEPETTTTSTVPETTTTTVPETTTTSPPTTVPQVTTTVPEPTTTTAPIVTVTTVPSPPSSELADTGADRRNLLKTSIVAESAIALGGIFWIVDLLARRKHAR